MSALYQQVYESLRTRIEGGELAVGDRLPTEAQLAEEHSVSTMTIKKSLELLRQDGLIIRRPRLGTFVASQAAVDQPETTEPVPIIGFAVTNFDDTFGTGMLVGMIEAASPRANLVIRRTQGRHDLEEQTLLGLVRNGAQALILEPSSSEWVAPGVLELITHQFPIVIVDRSLDRVPVSTVASDNLAGARMLTEHLTGLGHGQLGWISSSSNVSSLQERYTGFLMAHASSSRSHDERADFTRVGSTVPSSVVTIEDDVDALRAHLRANPSVTGYVASEYNVALLLHEAMLREGLGVPDDRSIVCFDQSDRTYDLSAFRYTHARQQQAEIGRLAVEQALAQIDSPTKVSKLSVPMHLVEGASTRSVS